MKKYTVEENAKEAARVVRAEVSHPLLPGGARRAILGLADVVEEMAHEIEIMKIRLGAINGQSK
jgi:hypothetical protein